MAKTPDKRVPVEAVEGTGYPQTDINKAGVFIHGRWIAGTGMKEHADMRGYGAATKGRKFLSNPGKTNR
jgi:hypothetical protein